MTKAERSVPIESKVTSSLAAIQRPSHRAENCKMVFLPQLLLISQSDWLIWPCRKESIPTLLASTCHAMPFSALKHGRR